MAEALRRAGRATFSETSFLGPLKRLLQSYRNEADLSATGRYATRFDIMRCLANRLRLDAAEDENPAITDAAIRAPIFITGLPRSATSFLHALLSLDPDNAVPRCWRLIHPYPPAMMAFWYKTQVEFQLFLYRCLTPGLAGLHHLSADEPQECTDITAHCFQSLRFDSTHHVPSYQAWLDAHGHDDAFRFHRRFLQHLEAQEPGHHWILKSPDHVFALDAIRKIYPDARIVFLHRDPLSVVASCSKLAELLRRSFARRIDRVQVGRQVSTRLIEGTQRMMQAASASDDILHLHYRDVVSAPLETVRKLYAHSGRRLGTEGERRIESWLARPKRRPHRPYRLSDFGLDAGALSERFAPYKAYFDIKAERSLADYYAA
ncbi:MAG TPA: sulfotransferase [Rhizomicrobium sp.]|nr:sulfotransferase [Rhizomicrobium sp.]